MRLTLGIVICHRQSGGRLLGRWGIKETRKCDRRKSVRCVAKGINVTLIKKIS